MHYQDPGISTSRDASALLEMCNRPLDAVAIVKRNSIGYLHAIFDAHEAGHVALPVDERDAVIPPGVTIHDHRDVTADAGWFTRHLVPIDNDDFAQIALSSGTTGLPKAVVLSHRALADVVHRLIEIMQIDSSIREYVGIPVTFSFGYGRIRAIAAAGGHAYIPAHGFRPDEFAGMLETGEVNALSAVPTQLRLLLATRAPFKTAGRKLRWLEIGSQYMTAVEKSQIRELFPNARIVQHYGLTEASRSSFLVVSNADADLESIGTPTGKVDIRVEADHRIAIRGPHLASGLLTADGLVPISDPFGWLVTNDLGHWKADQLHFDGRADDMVNVGGAKVPSEAFERELLSICQPHGDVAVTGVPDPLLGQRLIIATTSVLDSNEGSRLHAAALQLGRKYRVADAGIAFVPTNSIPRTDTSKVRRKQLAEQLAVTINGHGPESIGPETDINTLFETLFGSAAKDRSRSFLDLGGDSISYLRAQLALEAAIHEVPAGWEALPQSELLRLAGSVIADNDVRSSRQAGRLPANLDTLRGLACLLIVAVHVVGVKSTHGLQLAADSPWHRVMETFEFVRLPLFTCLAGIFYGAIPPTASWVEYTWRRVRQLAPALLFATAAYWLLRRWIYGVEEDLLMAYVDGYLHLWYLDAILIIVAGVAAIDLASRGRDSALVATTVASMACYFVIPDLDFLHIRNAIYLLPFFVCGVMLYRHPRLWQAPVALPIALSLAILQPVTLNLGWAPDGTPAEAILTWISGSAMVIVLIRLLPSIPVLSAIAAFSFTIYLWHPAASAAVRNGMQAVGIDSVPLLFLVALVAGVTLPVAVHRLAGRLHRFGVLLKV